MLRKVKIENRLKWNKFEPVSSECLIGNRRTRSLIRKSLSRDLSLRDCSDNHQTKSFLLSIKAI